MKDRETLRELARRYREICEQPVQTLRRDLWRRHNSLIQTRPLIYVRAFAWAEMPHAVCVCEDPFFRHYENVLRNRLFWYSLDDDSVFEPWLTVTAVPACAGWGVSINRRHGEDRGSFKIDYPLEHLADVAMLRKPWHAIDESATAEVVTRLNDAIGDILTVSLDRGPAYRMWSGDISTDLGYLRGIENFMIDMLDDPDGLHRLIGFLAAGVRDVQDAAEAAGDWTLDAHQNQAMPYALELPDPTPNSQGAKRRQLWGYMAAQEFTAVSPAMHEEFLLRYQRPILETFGLSAYGCCEDLTRKIGMLRQISNLRRIAVSPFADVAACAEQIGRDYVLSYRPSPADMVSYGLDDQRVCAVLTRDLEPCRESHVDITLKDVETVQHDPDRVRHWVTLTRRVVEKVFG